MPSKTALIFLIVFFAGCLATLLRSPYYGILLYEVQYFFNPPARWWYGDLPDLRYSFLIVVLILMGFIPRLSQFRDNRLLMAPPVRWLGLMTGVVLVAFLWAVSFDMHLEFTIRYLKVIFFALLAYKLVDTPKRMEGVFAVYLVGIFYLSWIAWEGGRTGGGRLEGIGCADTMDANGSAAVVGTAVPLLMFYILFAAKRWIKALAFVGLTFTLNCLVLLNSRGGFLALVAGTIYFIWFVFREPGGQAVKRKVVVGVIAGILLFLYLADESFWMRMSTLQEVGSDEGGGGSHRIQFWMKTFEMLQDYPLGAGARGYHLLSPHYLPAEWLSGGMRAVHSTWFEVLSEYGYHGFIVFVGYIVSSFSMLRKTRQSLREDGDWYHVFQSVALGASFVSLLVASTFINFFYGELMYWLPLYMAAFANIHMFRKSRIGMAHGME